MQYVSESSYFFFSRVATSHNFIMLGMEEGLGAAYLERLLCLASGLNYSPCWASISVSEGRENNLSNSSSQLETGPWDCTQLGSSPRCQFALIKCNRESAVARIEKHFQQNEKTIPGPVLATQRYLCSNFHTITPWQHHLTIWWDIDHFAVMLI